MTRSRNKDDFKTEVLAPGATSPMIQLSRFGDRIEFLAPEDLVLRDQAARLLATGASPSWVPVDPPNDYYIQNTSVRYLSYTIRPWIGRGLN